MICKCNILLISTVLTAFWCCWAATSSTEQSDDTKNNASVKTSNSDTRTGKYLNYIRLPDGECYNCSTYKCTDHKGNMGGSEWCIMLFSDALAHCDSDPTCGGYTMTTAEWFHKKYDKNGQVAVHLAKSDQKPIACPVSEWSSYEKQTTVRSTPVIYGRTTCEDDNKKTCQQTSKHSEYTFVKNSYAVGKSPSYSCNDHPNKFDNKDLNCILPIVDGVALCNSDDKCDGFMINTDPNWHEKFLKNGMQAVQLFGKGVTYTPSQTWRSFEKQH